LIDALRRHRTQRGTHWRHLQVGDQALLVLVHLRKGETYTDLAVGFGVGMTTCSATSVKPSTCSPRWLLPWPKPSKWVRCKAFVICDGPWLSIDRVGMASRRDRQYFSGKHKCHGVHPGVGQRFDGGGEFGV
jgi:hypothetical protein